MRALLLAAGFIVGCGGGDSTATWTTLQAEHPASLLGVWGSSTKDVWVVGGDARDTGGDGLGPLVLRYDGTAWTRLDTGLRRVDIWWVFGFENGPVFLGGSGGTILRYENGNFVKMTTPGTGIVFGMWGASPTDVWAVGGQFAANGFAWHFDGTSWTAQTLDADLSMNAVWKVTGRAANDVWFSASAGTVLHWDGQALARENVGSADELLFSIAVTSDRVVAVGGNITNGRIFERVGTTWTSTTADGTDPVWRGVSARKDEVYAVGQEASVARRTSDGWKLEIAQDAVDAFHADWIDPDGGLWAVGGKFDRIPPIDGQILYKGTATIGPVGL